MINSINPHMSGAGATERSPLVEQLVRRADGNGDGQVTSAEFSSFLTNLMQSLDREQASHRAADSPVAAPSTAGVQAATVLPGSEGTTLTRAEGAHLLRQAFEPVTRHR